MIKDLPSKKILWWFDHSERYADFNDYISVYDKYYVVEEGLGHPNMTIGIDPDIHRRIENDEEKYKCDVIFAGTAHPTRSQVVIDTTYMMPWTTKIWGNSWNPKTPNWVGPAIYFDELFRAYSASKLVLNKHYFPGITPNMRAIEAPASGTAMISDTGIGIEHALRKDKEYISYKDTKDAKRLIVKYLEDVDEREKIAKAGKRKVFIKHLLKDKLAEMLK